MNYKKLYKAFIDKYKNQEFEKDVYTEKHHIIPRHAGGDDSRENIIRLTYRQHVFAHRLLWKAYGKTSDYVAWLMMKGQTVDQKVARGIANAESGLLARIRPLANTTERQRKLKELNEYKVSSGLLEKYRLLANEAWRGQKQSNDWKINKSFQMKEYRATEEGYASMMKAVKLSAEKKTLDSKEYSDNLIENAERKEEFLHMSSSRSLNKFISPEGLEFDSPVFAAKYYGNGVKPHVIENWCKRNKNGWSRKPKAAQE